MDPSDDVSSFFVTFASRAQQAMNKCRDPLGVGGSAPHINIFFEMFFLLHSVALRLFVEICF